MCVYCITIYECDCLGIYACRYVRILYVCTCMQYVFMYGYDYVRMYVCMQISMYVYACICSYLCIKIAIHVMHICIYLCMYNIFACREVHVRKHVCVSMYV